MKENYFKRYYPEKLNDDEQLLKVTEGYHMTPMENITSILNQGLVVRKGAHSQHEEKERVYFTTTKEGILCAVNRGKFGIYYRNKEKYQDMQQKDLEIDLNEKIEKVFFEGPMLKLNLKSIKVNEPEYGNGPEPTPANRNTEQTILPERIRVMIVKNKKTGEISTKCKDIIGYFQGDLKRKNSERYEIFEIKEFDEYDYSRLQDTEIDTISLEEYIEIINIKEKENLQSQSKFIQDLRAGVTPLKEQSEYNSDSNNSIIKENDKKNSLMR